jgi:hypothetical protein
MNFLTITKNANGSYTIKDSITDKAFTYYFCSEREAIKQHRENTNTQKKHFTKIHL